MDETTRLRIKGELERFFDGPDRVSAKVLPDGGTLFRVRAVPLPKGCSPALADALLSFPPANGGPKVSVTPGVKLANGSAPTSTSNTTIDGEAWMDFSANLTYDPAQSAAFFILGKLNRFARSP